MMMFCAEKYPDPYVLFNGYGYLMHDVRPMKDGSGYAIGWDL